MESCFGYFIEKFLMGLKNTLNLYLAVHILPVLIFRIKQLKADPKKIIYRALNNLICSSMFLSTEIAFTRFGPCLLSYVTGTLDQRNILLGTFLGSLGILFEKHHRRIELLLYILPKFLEGIAKALDRRGLYKPLPH
jgi:hypothetical protein